MEDRNRLTQLYGRKTEVRMPGIRIRRIALTATLLVAAIYLVAGRIGASSRVVVTFRGAAREVGGSCQTVETGRSGFIVDCGAMGSEGTNMLPNNAERYSFVILTHAHTDHCGLLPELFDAGFDGKVYCLRPTAELVPVMLRMARSFSRNKVPKEIFDKTLASLVNVEAGEKIVEGDVAFTLREAGHLLGAAFAEVVISGDEGDLRLVFSGDLGSGSSVLLKSPKKCEQADYVIIESTYGGRSRGYADIEPFCRHDRFLESVGKALESGGDVLIPSFTLGRTQEMIAVLHLGIGRGIIPPETLIYSDSPTANRISRIYRDSITSFSDRSMKLFGNDILRPANLREVRSKTSMKVHSRIHDPSVFITSSGDLEHANSPRHLVRMCSDSLNLLCLVGWQPPSSLGRQLENGVDPVLVRHREGNKTEKDWISPAIKVERFNSFSGHADQDGLIDWLSSIKGVREVFIVHGDLRQSEALSVRIEEELGLTVSIPRPGEPFKLSPLSSARSREDSLIVESSGKRWSG